jgi:hypothetical protein
MKNERIAETEPRWSIKKTERMLVVNFCARVIVMALCLATAVANWRMGLNQTRRDDFDFSISVAIWSIMSFTLGRSFGRLFASCRMSPPIARGVNCCDERAAIARTACERACAKAVTKSDSNSSSLFMVDSLVRVSMKAPQWGRRGAPFHGAAFSGTQGWASL